MTDRNIEEQGAEQNQCGERQHVGALLSELLGKRNRKSHPDHIADLSYRKEQSGIEQEAERAKIQVDILSDDIIEEIGRHAATHCAEQI